MLRDFYHDLEGRTPKQYLEECLQEASGFSADTLRKNKVRSSIQRHFKERECFTLVRPIAEEARLAHIESENWEELKPEFKR